MLGQFDDPRQRARCLHHSTVPASAECITPVQANDEIQALVQNARKRPRRVECQWRQNGHYLFVEIFGKPRLLLLVPLMALHEADAGICELGEQDVVQQRVLLTNQFRNLGVNLVEHFLRKIRRGSCS
jgi:hypothetical protein